MKFDYSVDVDALLNKDANDEKAKKKAVKTRASMQNTVMNALVVQQPQNPGGPIPQATSSQGWGQTGA